VYIATEKKSGREFALKKMLKIDPETGKYQDIFKECYDKEVAILSHVVGIDSVISMHDYFEDKEAYYVVTSLGSGGDFFDYVSAMRKQNATEEKIKHLARMLIEPIAACHAIDCVHRDIKPENYVLESNSEDAKLILIDFGCASVTGDTEILDQTVQSPYYYAPECIDELSGYAPMGSKRANGTDYKLRTGKMWKAADMWSIGVIIHLLTFGQLPFNEDDEHGAQEDKTNAKILRADSWKLGREKKASKPLKDLIKKLIVLDWKKRLTAEQALRHAFFTTTSDRALDRKALGRLGNFIKEKKKENKLRNALVKSIYSSMEVVEKQKLIDLFNTLDGDHSGSLEIAEIEESQELLGLNNDDEVKRFFRNVSCNDTGVINQNQFVTAMLASRLTQATRQEYKERFDNADTDGSGGLDKQELMTLLPHLSAERVAELFDAADTNGDGVVDFEEWVTALESY
jgi:calcium-dependent protein kinase